MGLEPGIVTAIISGITAIIVSYIGVSQKRNQKRNDKCEALRQEGALLQLEMTQAILRLSKVTAKAVRNQALNGDVEEAEHWVHEVEIKFADYMRRMSQIV